MKRNLALPKVCLHADRLPQTQSIYLDPEVRQDMLRIWSYPMLRAAFDDAVTDDMRDDIAAELARRGGMR